MVSFSAEKRFIVTGASSGIGEAVALLLNELGASVIGVGRNAERLECMRTKARCSDRVFLEQKDIAEEITGLPLFVKSLREKYGKLAGLAYCAGVSSITPLKAWSYEDASKMFDINYFAPLAMLKGIADKRNNVGLGTAIVMMASAAACLADKGQVTYAGTKSALLTSCRAAAKELAIPGVRVNTVAPTIINTPMTTGAGAEYADSQKNKYPLGFGEVSDVANLVVFLLSDKARWITGQNYVVDCASF